VSVKVALAEIKLQGGKQFDGDLACAFEQFVLQLVAAHPSIEAYLEVDAKKSPLAKALSELSELLAAVTDHSKVAIQNDTARPTAPRLWSASNRPTEPL